MGRNEIKDTMNNILLTILFLKDLVKHPNI